MNIDKIKIRPGTVTDLTQVTDLWGMLHDYHINLDPRLPSITADGPKKWQARLKGLLDSSTFRLQVAEDQNGQLLGFATGFVQNAPEVFEQHLIARVADIFVLPAWHKRGVGKRLLLALTEWFVQKGADHIEMNLVTSNPAAVSFWHSVGAQEFTKRMWLPVNWMEGDIDQE